MTSDLQQSIVFIYNHTEIHNKSYVQYRFNQNMCRVGGSGNDMQFFIGYLAHLGKNNMYV